MKTEVQNIGAGLAPDVVQIGSQTVEPVTKFIYLGSDIDSGGYSIAEIHRCLGPADSIMGQIDRVWKQR